LLGLTAVTLKLDSSLVRRDTNHRLSDLDIGFSLNIMYDTLTRGLPSGQTKVKFKGVSDIAGRRAYTVENWNADAKANRYYCAHSAISHEFATGLPIKIANYDERDQLFEEFEWANLETNVGLTDTDFDPANPQYRLK
jgi:hypothetical protein